MALADLPLLDLIPAISNALKSPYHLREWCAIIERAATEPVRALCACPIRHYKTTTTLHGIVWLLLKDPTRRIILLTHSHDRAQTLGKQLRQLARATEIGPARGWDTIDEWRNAQGGGVVIMSADQSRLGHDCGALFFDDPLDEMGWDDPKKRETVDLAIAHYTARCMRAGQPGPVLGVASRGNPDDPIGRRLSRSAVKWEYVHYPAILDIDEPTERAFAPDVWPLEQLKQMRAELRETDPTERIWQAQLMGNPRPAGSDLFKTPARYTTLPPWGGYRTVYGADFAYTTGDHADWFVLIAARAYGRKLYIRERWREKIDATLIEGACKRAITKYGRAPIYSYQSGPEIGLSKILIERGVPIQPLKARYNKLVRAQRTVKRWNDGDILVPDEQCCELWVPSFLHLVSVFRGHDKDDNDDDVDALVSMADGGLGGAGAPRPTTLGTPGYS